MITAFEELKPMFIEDAGPIPSYFSSNSELSLIEQAKYNYGFLPTLRGVIIDTGTYQSKDLEEDLNPQLTCIVKGHLCSKFPLTCLQLHTL